MNMKFNLPQNDQELALQNHLATFVKHDPSVEFLLLEPL